jgi:hypothetical protein
VGRHATGSHFGVAVVARGCQKRTKGERRGREHGPFHRSVGARDGIDGRMRAFDDRPAAASFSRIITATWPISLHSRSPTADDMDLSTARTICAPDGKMCFYKDPVEDVGARTRGESRGTEREHVGPVAVPGSSDCASECENQYQRFKTPFQSQHQRFNTPVL